MYKLKDIFWIALVIAIVGYVIYKIARNSFTDYFIGDHPQITKAVIIDDKNFMGNQPVAPEFSYSYQFIVEGAIYSGNSHDSTLKVGDTVEIKYNKNHPGINKPLHPLN